MRHELLTQRAIFVSKSMEKRNAESALCDTRRTSSGLNHAVGAQCDLQQTWTQANLAHPNTYCNYR